MGTRSTTKIYEIYKDNYGKEERYLLCAFYRQMDGYVSGHGRDLKEFILSGKQVNGISCDEKRTIFNGTGCMAAQMVAAFKTEPGSIYMTTKDDSQEYDYEIWFENDKVQDGKFGDPKGEYHIKIESYGNELYKGPVKDMPEEDDE